MSAENIRLPFDVARCPGVGDYIEGFREGCEDCHRRLAKLGDHQVWLTPPPIIAFECEYRIGR